MKFFAIAALMATASAVKLSALNKAKEPDMPSWEDVLAAIDADGSGTISWPELKGFMHEVAEEHDFELTPEMVDEVHEVFKMVDADGSGDVDKAEFEAAVAAHGALGQRTRKVFSQVKSKQGPPTWEEILEVLDEDDSGTVSWGEIEAFIAEMEEQHGEKLPKDVKAEIKKVFDMVDADGSGDIDKAEFEAAMAAHGALGQRSRKAFKKLAQMKAKQGPPSWEEILEVLDEDDSGTVSWGEIEGFIAEMEEQHGEKLPEDVKKEIKKVFDMVDSDGSGDIDKAEFEAAMAAHGLGQRTRKAFSQLLSKQGPPSWEEILEYLDTDNSGTISWSEIEDFIAMMEEQHGEKMPADMKAEVKKVFDMVDTDGSGDIDKAEFEAAMAAHGALGQKSRKVFSQLRNKAKQGPPTWEEILEVLDSDASGTVSWPEIEAFIAEMEKQHGEKLPEDIKAEIKKVFDMVDADGSGDIDKAEFEAAMAAHGALGQRSRRVFSQIKNKSKAKQAPSWEQVLELLDADDSGTVSWEEIVAFVKEWENETGNKLSKEDKEMMKAAFEYVDQDGSGDIDKKEFEAAVASMEGLAQMKKMF